MKKKQKEFLCVAESKNELSKEWDKHVIISLREVKRLLRAFKETKSKTLIFDDEYKTFFRKVGEQHKFYTFVPKEKIGRFYKLVEVN